MKRKLPPLNALRAFEAAARHCSFRLAAEELSVSHSAISHQVKLLEDHLNIELFMRKARSVDLTKLGRFYYPVLRDAFDRMAEGTELILKPQSATVITVHLYSTFAVRWLIPRLADFQKQYPEIQVRLNTSQYDVDFNHDDVDVSVMIGSNTRNDIHYELLFNSRIFPVCSPGYRDLHNIEEDAASLSKHTLLQVYPSEQDWYYWLKSNNAEQVNTDEGLRFDSYDHAISSALAGVGIALGITPYVEKELREGHLVEPFNKRLSHPDNWYLAYRKERRDQPKIKIFQSWLKEQIDKDEDIEPLNPEPS